MKLMDEIWSFYFVKHFISRKRSLKVEILGQIRIVLFKICIIQELSLQNLVQLMKKNGKFSKENQLNQEPNFMNPKTFF